MSMTFTYDETGPINKILVEWAVTAGAPTGTTKKISGMLLKGLTIPDGDNAPTDQYDIVVTDPEGKDIFAGLNDGLRNRSDTDTEETYFYIANGRIQGAVVAGKLTITVSNAGLGGTGRIVLFWMKSER